MVGVFRGDIAYGTSECFWMPGTSDSPGHLDVDFRSMLADWEGCKCTAALLSLQWRDRVVTMRQQASLPEAVAGEPLQAEQHIAAAAESLRDEIGRMTQKKGHESLPVHCASLSDTKAQRKTNCEGCKPP